MLNRNIRKFNKKDTGNYFENVFVLSTYGMISLGFMADYDTNYQTNKERREKPNLSLLKNIIYGLCWPIPLTYFVVNGTYTFSKGLMEEIFRK